MFIVMRFQTGEPIPNKAKYLSTQTETIFHPTEWADVNGSLHPAGEHKNTTYHYFLVACDRDGTPIADREERARRLTRRTAPSREGMATRNYSYQATDGMPLRATTNNQAPIGGVTYTFTEDSLAPPTLTLNANTQPPSPSRPDPFWRRAHAEIDGPPDVPADTDNETPHD